MHQFIEKSLGFMGSREKYEDADIVLVGVPMDFTVSFRPGTRMGPQQVRTVSIGIEEYSVYLDRDLADCRYYDAGDIVLPFGNVTESLNRIQEVTSHLLSHGKKPIFIGGEHLVTYPIVKAVAAKVPDLTIIHFDAHADLRENYLDEVYSHATVMRRVCETVGAQNVYQFGVRSGTKEEFAYAKENTHLFVDQVLEPLEQLLPTFKGRPVYITLDIDVVDPAYAPGTGTPEPGGCSTRDIIKAIHLLGQLEVVGFDLVEVSPVYDTNDQTALLAAKLIREAILVLW